MSKLPPIVPPGWNDPPNVTSSTGLTPGRPKLNKRMAFPMQTTPMAHCHEPPSLEIEKMYMELESNIKKALDNIPGAEEVFKIMLSLPENWKSDISMEHRQNIMKISRHILAGELTEADVLIEILTISTNLTWFSLFFKNVIGVKNIAVNNAMR